MKTRIMIIAAILLFTQILTKETFSLENKKMDIIGEAFNTDNKPVVAVSYGVAGTGGYVLREGISYMKPEMVMKIAEEVRPPIPGPLEAVNEVSITLWY